jgi:hypothetical protein
LRNPLALGSGALLAAALLAGCNDSVTCIFTSGCGNGPGAISDNEAALPVDGDVIVDGRPDVVGFFPSGSQNPGTIPIVVVFSETMLGATLLGALEVVPILGGGTFGQPVQGLSQALVSDGRVLLLFPLVATGMEGLPAGDYIVRLAPTAEVTDLTGQELDRTAGEQIGDFTIALTPPTVPRLVTTFPAAGAVDQSPTTEIVAVFDRAVTPQSVTPLSFDVRVDGVDPVSDPPAEPVVVQVGATSAPDPRAWVWRSLDGAGRAQSLGEDAQVELRISPAASPITDEDGGIVPPATVTFRTLPFAPPLAASLLSDPPDAIGLANLTDGDVEELTIEVELDGLQPNDTIDLFLFGLQRSEMPDPPLIAVQRSVQLTGTAPIQSVVFTREQIPLQLSDAPADVRFEDGPVTFAFRARRGSRVSPLRVLDLDPDPLVIQDPLLDTQAPTVSDLVGTIGTTVFRSDQRGLSLAGQADEPLRAVEVSTPLGGNGTLPPVVGSSPGGLFLAAPVPLGRLDAPGTTTFTFAARDEALNTAPSLTGTYTQLGAVGPGAWTPGADITVQVFDAGTLGPLAGAQVIVHADMGDGVSYPFVQAATTLGDGSVTVSTAGPPSVAAIVTVAAGAYDLFTLHGTPSTRLSVPLFTANRLPASAVGAARTTDPAAIALLPGLDQRFDDSRRPVELPRGFPEVSCGTIQGVLACTYGPEPIAARQLGARTFHAGDFTQTEPAFSAAQLVQAFALEVPLAPASPGQAQQGDLEIPFLLFDAQAPPDEAALPMPAFDFRVDAGSGIDLAMLDDDPATSGTLFATVETLVPGIGGAVAVATGLSYPRGAGLWTVRAAAPGAITPAGSLGSQGTVETDPYVRVEAVDLAGNAVGVRPRLSDVLAGAPAPEFRALAVPTQLAPAAGAPSAGQAFTVTLAHAIGDERAMGGLYRVRLVDQAGRGWDLWRFDPPGASDVAVRVVDPMDAGALGLADGSVTSTTAAYAWSTLAPLDFLWSDVEREFELFSRGAPLTFSKP